MKFVYTKHAEGKLRRKDIKTFKINKKLIETTLSKSKHKGRTKYGEFAELVALPGRHVLRIIYDIIGSEVKIITFHIAKKGRYD